MFTSKGGGRRKALPKYEYAHVSEHVNFRP